MNLIINDRSRERTIQTEVLRVASVNFAKVCAPCRAQTCTPPPTPQPTGTRDRATNMSWHGLCDDLKQIILGMSLQDRRGNTTVSGLVLSTGLRRVSKSMAAQYASIETPYDGEVTYEGSRPLRFVGGCGFDEKRRFFIVRDPHSGHVFACTVESDPFWAHGEALEVDRLWPLWRLAQLLNGHCADFSKRLPDLVAVAGGAEVLVARHKLLGPRLRDHEWDVVRTHNQIETLSHNGLDAPPQAHKDDFISHVVRKRGASLFYLAKHPTLVLGTALDYGYDLCHLDPRTLDDAPPVFAHDDGLPPLGVALGWYDRGDVVQATGWMTSIYCHGRKGVPTCYRRAFPEDQLRRMGVLAQRRVDKRAFWGPPVARGSQKRGRGSDGPAARVGRQPRGAALAAKRKMGDQLMCDAYQNSDGRLQSWLKPKEAHDLEKTRGIGDDQYADPGDLPTPDYDSDGAYSPDSDGNSLTPSQQRAKNHAAALVRSLREYAAMLVPSDDEE